MKNFLRFLWKEEIFQTAAVVFCIVIVLTLAAVHLAPYQIWESDRVTLFQMYGSVKMWMFVLVPPFVLAVITIVILAIATLVTRKLIKLDKD